MHKYYYLDWSGNIHYCNGYVELRTCVKKGKAKVAFLNGKQIY